ncbi:MAG TPA: hypothetical protein PLV81_01740, partial [Spirochaetota bacterium]|nr:hypothetical protein [Spirochaetota bacterium]
IEYGELDELFLEIIPQPHMLIKQVMKLVVIIAVLFIMFAGYIYIKNGSLPANLKGYAEEGKIAIDQLHQSYLKLIK